MNCSDCGQTLKDAFVKSGRNRCRACSLTKTLEGELTELAATIERRTSGPPWESGLSERIEAVVNRMLNAVVDGTRPDKPGLLEHAVEKEWRERLRMLRDPDLTERAEARAPLLTNRFLMDALESIGDQLGS